MKVEWTNKDSLASEETTKAILVIDDKLKCRSCNCFEPVDYYCDKYLRGVETAIYLCLANEVADLIDAQPTIY